MRRRSIGKVEEISVFRPGGVSYLRIPAPDPAQAAEFYTAVFGWKVPSASTSFEDGTGHVIGHFMPDLSVAGEAGIVPYIYVQDIDGAMDKVRASGGEVTTEPYPEGDLWVAMTADPAGNAIGVWTHGLRQRADE
jgi:uncharacterized protein